MLREGIRAKAANTDRFEQDRSDGWGERGTLGMKATIMPALLSVKVWTEVHASLLG